MPRAGQGSLNVLQGFYDCLRFPSMFPNLQIVYSMYPHIWKFCFDFGLHLGAERADLEIREEKLWNCGMKTATRTPWGLLRCFLRNKIREDEGRTNCMLFQRHATRGTGNFCAKQTQVQLLTLSLSFSEPWFPCLWKWKQHLPPCFGGKFK